MTVFAPKKCVRFYDWPPGSWMHCYLSGNFPTNKNGASVILHQRTTDHVSCPETASISALTDFENFFVISCGLGFSNRTPSSLFLSLRFSGLLFSCTWQSTLRRVRISCFLRLLRRFSSFSDPSHCVQEAVFQRRHDIFNLFVPPKSDL